MTKIRMPGDIHIPTKFFSLLTPKDLVRIGTPGLIVALNSYSSPSLETVAWLLTAAVLGITWAAWKPYNQPLDSHLYNAVRWKIIDYLSEPAEIEDIHESIVESENGSAAAVIEVEPTNLEMKTQAEQKALHNIYRELIHAVNYPLEIHSRGNSSNFQNISTTWGRTRAEHSEKTTLTTAPTSRSGSSPQPNTTLFYESKSLRPRSKNCFRSRNRNGFQLNSKKNKSLLLRES